MQYSIPLIAGKKIRQELSGRQFKLGNISDRSALVEFDFFNTAGMAFGGTFKAPAGLTYNPPNGFGGFNVVADKDCTLLVYITDGYTNFDVDINGSKLLVSNTAADPLYVTTPPGQTLNVAIPQPNGCLDAIHVDVCPPKPAIAHTAQKITASPSISFQCGNPAARRFILRNTGTQNLVIEPNGNTGSGAILLKPDEAWMETDNPNGVFYAYCASGTCTANIEYLV